MYNLTDKQKDLLRWLVSRIREDKFKEEFIVAYYFQGSKIIDFQEEVSPLLTKGNLKALAIADLITYQIQYSNQKLGMELSRTCTLLGKAYEAVNSSFGLFTTPAKKRFHFLSTLYKKANGSILKESDMYFIGKKCNFDHILTQEIVQFLEEEGTIKLNWKNVNLTTLGIKEVEKAKQAQGSNIEIEASQKPAKENDYNILKEEFKYKGVLKSKETFKCFVIMPIGKKDTIEYTNNMRVFGEIIRPCVENSGYTIHCYHSDLIGEPGSIPEQIINKLYTDDIVIADLRRQNTNVIWELGVRHAFKKRSIMICSDYKQTFFDTAVYRVAQYNITGKSNQEFYERIKVFLYDVINKPNKPDNPVMHHPPSSKGRRVKPRILTDKHENSLNRTEFQSNGDR
jgi:predicted transcriptional regulator